MKGKKKRKQELKGKRKKLKVCCQRRSIINQKCIVRMKKGIDGKGTNGRKERHYEDTVMKGSEKWQDEDRKEKSNKFRRWIRRRRQRREQRGGGVLKDGRM